MDALKTKRVMNEMKTRVPQNITLVHGRIEIFLQNYLKIGST